MGEELEEKGFVNIAVSRVMEETKAKPGTIMTFAINDNAMSEEDWYRKDVNIFIEYYEPKSSEEIAADHPDEIMMPEASKYYVGKQYNLVVEQLEQLGFTNIILKEVAMSKFAFLEKENNVAKVIVDGQNQFAKETWFSPEVEIIIYRYISL